ncbi:unnamed protein product [Leptosia nina]|uniref:DUF243 domain-containing protein n=1 Tax=Leptosia nina TaxID=320188 RepID=A0AAV1JZ20_9NEOP
MAWLSVVFGLSVVTSVYSGSNGYFYPKPGVAFEYSNPIQSGQIFQKTVSFSVSDEYNSDSQNVGGENALNLQVSDGNFKVQSYQYNPQSEENVSYKNVYNTFNFDNNDLLDNRQVDSQPVQNPVSTLNANQDAVRQEQSRLIDERNLSSLRTPVVTKHIYFHVPPTDTEEYVRVTPPQPRKAYKILFITLPTQKQNTIANRKEEKTLIYVLVQKPEDGHFLQQPPKLSEHEVVFVKYRGRPSLGREQLGQVVEIPRRNAQPNSQGQGY